MAGPVVSTAVTGNTSTRPRQLPLEIWTMVVSHVIDNRPLDAIHAWLTFREVSRQLKRATELAFIGSTHLRNTAINFDGIAWVPSATGSVTAPMKFEFHEPSEDGHRIIFKYLGTQENTVIKTPSRQYPGVYDDCDCNFDEYIRHWKVEMQPWIEAPSDIHFHPWHTVSFNNIATNDTRMEGLEIDLEAMELSVPWKLMLTRLLREEDHINHCLMSIYGDTTIDAFRSMRCFRLGDQAARQCSRLWRAPRNPNECRCNSVSLMLGLGLEPPSYIAESRKANMWYGDWKGFLEGRGFTNIRPGWG